jgi:hypothetical protein
MLRPLLSPITLGASYPKFATNGKVQTHLTVSHIRAKTTPQTDPGIRPEIEKKGSNSRAFMKKKLGLISA